MSLVSLTLPSITITITLYFGNGNGNLVIRKMTRTTTAERNAKIAQIQALLEQKLPQNDIAKKVGCSARLVNDVKKGNVTITITTAAPIKNPNTKPVVKPTKIHPPLSTPSEPKQIEGLLQLIIAENTQLRERITRLETQGSALPAQTKTFPTYGRFLKLCATNHGEAERKITKNCNLGGAGGGWKSVVKNVLDALRELWWEADLTSPVAQLNSSDENMN